MKQQNYISGEHDISFDELIFLKELMLNGGKLGDILIRLYPTKKIYRQYGYDRMVGDITRDEYYFTRAEAQHRIDSNVPKSPFGEKEKIEEVIIGEVSAKDFKTQAKIFYNLVHLITKYFDDVTFRKVCGKWGFINQAGELVIDYRFNNVFSFQEGLALISDEYPEYGFINTKGEFVIRPIFESAINMFSYSYEGFINGLAMVSLPTENNKKKIGYINQKGEVVINFQYDNGHHLSEGLIPVCFQPNEQDWKSQKWGYIDVNNNIVIDFVFSSASPFKNGRARVVYNDEVKFIKRADVGFEFIEGIREHPYACGSPSPYPEDYEDDALIPYKAGFLTYGYKNKNGEVIIEPFCGGEGWFAFYNGYMLARYYDDFGIFNIKGNFKKIHPEKDIETYFSGTNDGVGGFKIRSTGRWGFFNTEGKIIIPPQFYDAKLFSGGFAAVKKEKDYEILILKK